MKYIMFTKHLETKDVPGLIKALKSVGVEGADLCVRPKYPVNPENAPTALPAAAKAFAAEGLSIPLITTPGDFTDPTVAYTEPLLAACSAQAAETGNKITLFIMRISDREYDHIPLIALHGLDILDE